MRKHCVYGLVLWASLSFAQPPGPPISPSGGGGSGTVTGPGAACVDNQIARWDGATTTALQCSVLTVDDTTGNITAPGALTISTAIGNLSLKPGGLPTLDLAGTASAANYIEISGTASGGGSVNGPTIKATGSDAAVDMNFDLKGTSGRYQWKVGTVTKMDYTDVGGAFSLRNLSGGASFSGEVKGTIFQSNDDTYFYRDGAADTWGQRRAANQQTFRLYNTYTDGSNYERLSLSGTAGSSVNITAETAGTGADDLSVNVSGSGVGTVNLTRARIVPSAAPPVTCAAGTEGALYVDSDTHKLCYCNGSGWVLASDDSTGCS